MNDRESDFNRRAMFRAATAVTAIGATAATVAACVGPLDTQETRAESGHSEARADSVPVGTVLGSAADIPIWGGKVFADHKIVVTCPAADIFKAFSSTCTHRGCQVGEVREGTINCSCHGSQFSTADGSVKTGPATAPLSPIPIAERNGQLVVEA